MYKTLIDKLYALAALLGQLIGALKEEKIIPPLVPAPSTVTIVRSPGRILYEMAVMCLGKDMAPTEDEYGCMEAVNEVCFKALGDYAGGGTSTYRAIPAISSNKKFSTVTSPLPGDIIIYPTGYGNGNIPNGHAAIVGENNKVMSNGSQSKLWEQNYTLETMRERYEGIGGFPRYLFRRVMK